ncbi:MAG TPA: hypothetical protein VME46_13395 [Acidimicrobiales bacterium]|nr:hypothetical protein [Acidimicrobiales bacterium]
MRLARIVGACAGAVAASVAFAPATSPASDVVSTVAPASAAAPTRERSLVATAAQVAFAGPVHGWLTVELSPPSGVGSDLTEIFATRDGGSTWQLQWTGAGVPEELAATSAEHASVLLRTGTCSPGSAVRTCQARALATALLGTSTGGQSWATVWASPYQLSNVAWSSPSTGLASLVTTTCLDQLPADGSPLPNCPGQVVATADGGRHWAPVLHLPGPVVGIGHTGAGAWLVAQLARRRVSGAQAVEQTYLQLWGVQDRRWSPVGHMGGGSVAFSGPETRVSLLAPARGWWWMTYDDPDSCAMHGCATVGSWYSRDSGRTWAPAPLPPLGASQCGPDPDMPLAEAPTGVVYVSEGVNLAACSSPGGELERWDGRGWQRTHIWPLATATELSWPGAATGFAIVDGGLAKTGDGGRAWQQVWPALSPTGRVAPLGALRAWAAGDLTDPGAVLATSDGGRRWSMVADLAGLVTAIDFPDASDGFVVDLDPASNTWHLLSSSDGGHLWAERPGLPERAGFGGQDFGVSSIWMEPGGSGLALTTTGASLYGTFGEGPAVVWETSDGGRTWQRNGQVPVGAGEVDCAGFVYRSGGWYGVLEAAGTGYGSAAVALVTRDGGARWERAGGFPIMNEVEVISPQLVVGWAQRGTGRPVMYLSHDSGARWVATALPEGASHPGVGIGAAASLTFSGAEDGWWQSGGEVWTTEDAGRRWVKGSPG